MRFKARKSLLAAGIAAAAALGLAVSGVGTAQANSLTQVNTTVMADDGMMAVLVIDAPMEAMGQPAFVIVDGMVADGLALQPGPNFSTVPSATDGTYYIVGPGIADALAASYGQSEDDGAL